MPTETAEDFTELQKVVLDYIEEIGVPSFPSGLAIGKETALALWQGDDWRAFLSLASRVEADVIYVELVRLEVDDLSEDDSLDTHLGEPYRLSLAYMLGMVAHLWIIEAPWWAASQDRQTTSADREQAELAERCTRVMAQMDEKSWTRRVVEDPRFYGAQRSSERRRIARTILTELLGADAVLLEVDPRAVLEFRRACSRVTGEAESAVEAMRAKVADRALAEVPQLVEELRKAEPDSSLWSYRLREQRARRLVQERYGMNVPGVTAEVARRLAGGA